MFNAPITYFSDVIDETIKNISLLLIGLNDPYTEKHSIDVAEFSSKIAAELGIEPSIIGKIKLAGCLHDIGKQGIPKVILSKAGELSSEETELVKTHVKIGVDVLKKVNVSDDVVRMVSEHHERIDGSGYPKGLMGSEISIEGQIIGVADVVSALMTKRTYRVSATKSEVEEILMGFSSIQMDKKIVKAALKCIP